MSANRLSALSFIRLHCSTSVATREAPRSQATSHRRLSRRRWPGTLPASQWKPCRCRRSAPGETGLSPSHACDGGDPCENRKLRYLQLLFCAPKFAARTVFLRDVLAAPISGPMAGNLLAKPVRSVSPRRAQTPKLRAFRRAAVAATPVFPGDRWAARPWRAFRVACSRSTPLLPDAPASDGTTACPA